MNVLGVILARAGSVGLPGKHVQMLGGRPVIDYTFDHARVAQSLTRVVVSTDCPKIRELADCRGFQTLLRPADLATGDASVQDVLLHAMLMIENEERFHADAVVTLYGNVPVRKPGIIDQAVSLLARTGCCSVRSFCPVGKWNPGWMARLDGDRVRPLQSGSVHRRQDLEPLFLHDGAVVVSHRRAMDAAMANRGDPHAFFGDDRRSVTCEMTDTVEIDTRRDHLLAEAILRDQLESERAAA